METIMEMAWVDVYDASEWVIRFAMLFYVPYRRDAAAARGWLLLIFFLPWGGLLLYALFGRAYLPRQRRARQQAVREAIDRTYRQLPAAVSIRERSPAQLWPALELTGALSNFPVVGGNRFELIHDYQAAIDRLVAGIDAARSQVHLMYYIFADDAVGHRVSDALVRASQRGVAVRVLMDAIGARDGLKAHAPALRASGAEVVALLPLRLFRRDRLRPDLRNHRKIVVIDGAVAFFGSQNIVSPTANRGLTNEEMVVRAEGPVVQQLHAVLLGDRYLETADLPPEVDVSSHTAQPPQQPAYAQVLPSGPGYHTDTTENVMVGLIYAALSRVVLTTPYFIPSSQFVSAMCNAARRGVSVHLIVDKASNKPFVQFAQESYYDTLLEAGVQIHGYYGNFLHAKLMSVDESVALIGSSNLDRRSFELNEEVTVLVYDRSVAADLWQIEQGYLAKSDTVDPAAWLKRPAPKRLLQNVARLFDALM
jgi:cardiolipin synthase